MKIKNRTRYWWLLIGGVITILSGLLLKLNILPYIKKLEISILTATCSLLCEGAVAFGSGLVIAFFSAKIQITDRICEIMTHKDKEKIIDELLSQDDELKKYKQNIIKGVLVKNEEYRTGTVYTANAYIENNKVFVETTLRYTVHFVKHKEPISIRFDHEDGQVCHIRISNPQNSNDNVTFKKDKLTFKNNNAHGDGLTYEWSCSIPKNFKKCETLNIEKKYIISGEDHWTTYGIVFQHLTEGIDFTLNLNSDLKVKESTIFEKINVYTKEQDAKSFHLKTTEWLSNYGGFSLLISK